MKRSASVYHAGMHSMDGINVKRKNVLLGERFKRS